MSKTNKNACCVAEKEFEMEPVQGERADQDLAFFAKALGHPIRIQILRLLTAKKTCICGDIVDEMPLAQSTVSQHLKVLKEAGLICGNIEGTSTCYCMNASGLKRLKVLVAAI